MSKSKATMRDIASTAQCIGDHRLDGSSTKSQGSRLLRQRKSGQSSMTWTIGRASPIANSQLDTVGLLIEQVIDSGNQRRVYGDVIRGSSRKPNAWVCA